MGFMPHGVCWLWDWKLLLLHVTGDFVTFLAYMAIPAVAFWVYREGHLRGLQAAFPHLWKWGAAFVFLCGLSHLGSFLETWIGNGFYYATGVNKIAMGYVSCRFVREFWKARTDLIVIGRVLDAQRRTE